MGTKYLWALSYCILGNILIADTVYGTYTDRRQIIDTDVVHRVDARALSQIVTTLPWYKLETQIICRKTCFPVIWKLCFTYAWTIGKARTGCDCYLRLEMSSNVKIFSALHCRFSHLTLRGTAKRCIFLLITPSSILRKQQASTLSGSIRVPRVNKATATLFLFMHLTIYFPTNIFAQFFRRKYSSCSACSVKITTARHCALRAGNTARHCKNVCNAKTSSALHCSGTALLLISDVKRI